MLQLLLCSRRYRSHFDHRASSARQQEKKSDGMGLKVAVIGCPNVGKSALTNALIRSNVCAVSRQIDTTRTNTTTALTENDCQLVVVDSPGVVGIKHAKEKIGTHSDSRILVDPEGAIKYAEHVLVVQDVSLTGQYIHHRVLHLLHRYAHISATLVLNKIDMLPRRAELLHLTNILTEGIVDGEPIEKKLHGFGRLDRIVSSKPKFEESFTLHHTDGIAHRDEKWHELYNKLLQLPAHKCSWVDTRRLYKDQSGWPNFKSVFYVSCATGEGVDGLRDHLKQLSTPTVWHYDENTVTKKQPHKLCVEHIRSKYLNELPAYIAYQIGLHICEWNIDTYNGENSLRTVIDVKCEKERIARLVLRVTQRVENEVTEQLHKLFRMPVVLRLRVKHNGQFFIDHTDASDSTIKALTK